MRTISQVIDKLRSPLAHKVYLAHDYTKADLINDLEQIWRATRAYLEKQIDEKR